jgi:hypothetical protein
MADYTVIVDDSDSQIIYGPDADSWSPFDISRAYQGTLHNAMSQDANMTLSFVGGREIVIRGNFHGDNNASNSATYPIFQVDSVNLDCNPNPPQNGGQFLCGTNLPSAIISRTLTMFVNPSAAIQQFHIDYIRHGTNTQAAQAGNGTVLFVQSPNHSTPGLSFGVDWQKVHSLGDANDVKSAMQISTPSNATYSFSGDSFAWWSCCMPPDTSSNAASGTYSIDGGDATAFQIDEQFIQGPQCKDEKILFQTQKGQLQSGNHTIEVIYNGDSSKMPLTLCAFAAVPLDFNVLDIDPSSKSKSQHSSSSPSASSSTFLSSPSYSPSAQSSAEMDSHHGGVNTGIVAGVIAGIVFAFLSLLIVVYLLRRKSSRDVESSMSFDAPRLARRRVVPSIDLAAHDPPTRRTSIDKESVFEVPPPFYRSSMTKSRFSWRSLSFRAHPHQQTAYVGSDYGASVASFNPRHSAQSYHYGYQQYEPPRYNLGGKSNDPDPILPLP